MPRWNQAEGSFWAWHCRAFDRKLAISNACQDLEDRAIHQVCVSARQSINNWGNCQITYEVTIKLAGIPTVQHELGIARFGEIFEKRWPRCKSAVGICFHLSGHGTLILMLSILSGRVEMHWDSSYPVQRPCGVPSPGGSRMAVHRRKQRREEWEVEYGVIGKLLRMNE